MVREEKKMGKEGETKCIYICSKNGEKEENYCLLRCRKFYFCQLNKDI